MSSLLTLILCLPALGALLVLFLRSEQAQRICALLVSSAAFILSLGLLVGWRSDITGMQFIEQYAWLPNPQIQYYLGVDGISLWLVLLTTFLTPLVVFYSWQSVHTHTRSYYFFLLLMETAIIGVFVSLDLILFYLFWEASLIPMYFIIGQWGGPRRVYASVKFFLYTLAGSALMLVAILLVYFYGGTFDIVALQSKSLPFIVQFWAFLAFALGFAIKTPLFPFHTWLPDAHVEAPTAGSVILAGVLLKMGTYGFIRFCLPLFPQATPIFTPYLSALALIGILYGALVALRQRDIKSLVAYSSVAHLGFVVLGIFSLTPQGISGAVLQMVNHGLSTGALFLAVGMLYERLHTRIMSDFSGLWQKIPIFGSFFLIVVLSSIGLPGLNGFIGEFTILVGVFDATPPLAWLATAGIILAAWYLLTAFRLTMQGPFSPPKTIQSLPDLNRREIAILAPLIALFVVIGLFPNLFFSRINPTVESLTQQIKTPRPAALLPLTPTVNSLTQQIKTPRPAALLPLTPTVNSLTQQIKTPRPAALLPLTPTVNSLTQQIKTPRPAALLPLTPTVNSLTQQIKTPRPAALLPLTSPAARPTHPTASASPLPTSYSLLPISYFLPPISYFLPPISYFLPPISYFLPPTSYSLSPPYFLIPNSESQPS